MKHFFIVGVFWWAAVHCSVPRLWRGSFRRGRCASLLARGTCVRWRPFQRRSTTSSCPNWVNTSRTHTSSAPRRRPATGTPAQAYLGFFQVQTPLKWISSCYKSLKMAKNTPKINWELPQNPKAHKVFLPTSLVPWDMLDLKTAYHGYCGQPFKWSSLVVRSIFLLYSNIYVLPLAAESPTEVL